MKNVHLVKQHDFKDCGASCLSMILEYYGKKLPLSTIREDIKIDQDGASIYSLIDGAEKHGLIGNAFGGSSEDMWETIRAFEIELPAVIRIINNSYTHFAVVTKIVDEKMYIYDPDKGKYYINKSEFSKIFLGQIIIFKPSSNFNKGNYRKNNLLQFFGLVLKQKRLVASIGILSLFVTGIGLAGAFLYRYLIDSVLGDLSNINSIHANLKVFVILSVITGALYIVKLAIQMLRGKLSTTMAKNIDIPLILNYYNHIVDLPMHFFNTRKTGEIMSRFQDASKIRDAISSVTLTLMIDVIMVIACGFILFKESTVLACIALTIFAVYLIVSFIYLKPLDRFNRNLMENNQKFNSYLKETIDGIENIKTSQAEYDVKENAKSLFKNFVNCNVKGSILSVSKDAIIDFVTSSGVLMVLIFGAISIINGTMTLGTLVTFIMLLNYFLDPVQNLVELQSSIQTAIVAADRLNDALDLNIEDSGSVIPDDDINSVELKEVSFRYGNRKLILDNVNFIARKGEKIALVGESGCGKSTVTKLLMNLYKPENGNVYINGVSIKELSVKYLRSQTAYVSQNIFLFADTIRNNLFLGLSPEQIPPESYIKKIIDTCCGFVNELPMGLDSMLEENGTNLSGGQRQRIALARALLRRPKLLILDEATSALDSLTEQNIQNAFSEVCPDTIIINVAHRLSTVIDSDQILVVEKGNIIEKGKHDDLIKSGVKYKELWNSQMHIAPTMPKLQLIS